jgi:transcriptional regulator with XRE-family HTH domain
MGYPSFQSCAKNIRHTRSRKGVTQELAAEKAGLSTRRFQDLESSRRLGMRIETIKRIADVLRVEVWQLFKAGRVSSHPDRDPLQARLVVKIFSRASPIFGEFSRTCYQSRCQFSRPENRKASKPLPARRF